MKVKQQIINFYQILKELPDNEEYNVEGIRNRVSMKADNLLFTLDNKGNQGIDISTCPCCAQWRRSLPVCGEKVRRR